MLGTIPYTVQHSSAMTTQTIQLSPMQYFQKQWRNYQIVLEEDYLEHKGLYAALKQWLVRAAREKGPLRVADLGCGDSEYISRVIVEAGGPALVSSYTGVDLSEPALEFSKRNMARALGPDADARCHWHQEDYISFASRCTEDFDCILMSFAMHHSEHEGKVKLLQEGHRLLKARQGAFLLVDVIRLEGETLEEYHEREVADVSNTWTGLDHEGRESMCDHMMKYDFPEMPSEFQEMGRASGFTSMTTLFAASKRLSQFLVFQA